MKKHVVFLLGMLLMINFSFAQTLQSPETFLGYTIGTQFTRHHKIVDYVKHVAATKKEMVHIEQYGTTYEGRELMLVFISSPENMQRLEEIRKNNLTLTGIEKSSANKNTQNAPAIIWFSYNVHGNEPSSSEAALLTIYELVNPSNKETKEWLKNTVVIIDPCANPDGRDRYVNWYNQVLGIQSNTDVQSREHSEPWPNGRSNHYNFDLNRDWAWQTQIESEQRIKKYNLWMPQVHVDFHEQYYDNPYYFAPAAEPLHEAVTQWQRNFQEVIGRNHAKYFDANGWLYFTKESFDLFYPSYGDTYPIYNGSIGMTYEQAGHSRAGLAIKTTNGEILTLTDRVLHHYTTGISTIEASSNNAKKLVSEFVKYFDDANAAKHALYKTYILTSNNKHKIEALKKLLTANGILFGTTNTNNTKGFYYQQQKETDVKTLEYTIAVSTAQPKGVLANVLLEPKSKLSDSATYDITAWSIAYAYDINTYALKEKKEINYATTAPATIQKFTANYGYLIAYNSVNSVKALTYLLQKGIKVRYSEKPFMYKGKQYDRGTLIVIKSGNTIENINTAMNDLAKIIDVEIDEVATGFMDKGVDFGSPSVKQITAPKIVLLTGDGVSSLAAGEIWHFFDRTLGYPITLINANDFDRTNISNYQVIIMPDGYYKFLNDKNSGEKLKEFMANGGKVIALENAVSQIAKLEIGIKYKADNEKETDKEDISLLKKYADREKDYLPSYIPGAIYKIELDNTHPLAFGYDSIYYTLKTDANIYEFMKEGWNVGVLKKENYVAGFTGYKVKEKLKNGTVLGATSIGKGQLIFFAENPMFRLFWENGKLLFCNAVFLTSDN